MKIWIHILVCAMSSLAIMSQNCPSEHFSAVFTATIDQTVDNPELIEDDPELMFFKNYMNFRDSDIQHTIEDAIQFFKNKYGLDFSDSVPNEKNEYFIWNITKMSPFILPLHINYIVNENYWIRTGNTRSSCYHILDGGFRVTFFADQMLHGSYGETEGKPVGPFDGLFYGFYNIDVCQQSPVIIQYQSGTPFRAEPIDGMVPFNCDAYNHVLGHGNAQGIARIFPDPKEPGRYRAVARNVFTFPSL